jgi:serine O-acetyltransferase
MSHLDALMMDVWRWYGRANLLLVIKLFCFERAFRPVLTYRLCRWAMSIGFLGKIILPFLRIFHRLVQGAIGFELPLGVDLAPGLLVYHGWALVINDKVKIGKNVTLLHSVTIGGTFKGTPILEDEVSVATGAIILGPVVIGRGSIIGAGAVVTKDVEPYSIIVGNPQRLLKKRDVVNIVSKAPC